MISAVPEEWINGNVASALSDALEGKQNRILWLLTDHPDEGDFMLERIRDRCRSRRWKCRELKVHDEDTTLAWLDLAGSVDEAGLVTGLEPRTIVLVRAGAHLDESWLGRYMPALVRIARGCEAAFVIPMLHGQHDLCGDYLRHGIVFATPRFSEMPAKKRLATAQWLARISPPGDEPWPDDFISALVAAQPSSLTELGRWLEWYEARGPDGRLRVPPPLERLLVRPHPTPDRRELSARFTVLVSDVERNSTLFGQWQGRPLFKPVREASAPFSGFDAQFWFVSCVSYLACLFFDAADPALRTLARFRREGGDVAGDRGSSLFLTALRALRTRFQHGMDWKRREDQETRRQAEAWFFGQCGAGEPQRQHWRKLCHSLLEAWSVFNEQLRSVLAVIRDAPARDAIEAQILAESRILQRHEWARVIGSAVDDIAPHLDSEAVLDKRINDCQKRLRDSAVRAEEVPAEARRIAQAIVSEEGARAPISAADLLAAGVEKGPELALLLRNAQARFEKQPTLDKESLLQMVLQERTAKSGEGASSDGG